MLPIVNSTPASAKIYPWTIPNTISTQCKVRIIDITDNSIADTSSNTFTITPPTDVNDLFNNQPTEYVLHQNFPNPFNPVTRIYYSVPKECQVTLKLFNTLGEEIQTLVNEIKSTGNYWIDLDGSQLQTGVYVYQMKAEGFQTSKKLMLLK